MPHQCIFHEPLRTLLAMRAQMYDLTRISCVHRSGWIPLKMDFGMTDFA